MRKLRPSAHSARQTGTLLLRPTGLQSKPLRVTLSASDPRASFTGHVMDTPWDPLHRAYFMGYAQWTYLTTPFFMTMPGFEVTEISPWRSFQTSMWPAAFRRRNMSTILRRWMDSAFRLSAAPTSAGHI